MTDLLKLRIGARVICEGQQVGSLKRFIVREDTHLVTHLHVEPLLGEGKLVPVGYVGGSDDDGKHVRKCPSLTV
jgi:hypothetical protein